jgi:hypothetical protein
MTPHRAILALLHLFALFSFLGAAIFFLSLPILPNVRIQLCSLLIAHPNALYKIGGALLIASLTLLLGFYLFHRGRSLRVGMGASVNAAIILKTLEPFFKEHFPGQIELSDIHFSLDGKLEIDILSSSEDRELLEVLERGITSLLKERFGYSKSFFMNLKKH